MELLETLRLLLQCCNSDQRLRLRPSLRSRPLPQKKSILGPILSFVLDIENLQHNFSCLKRHFHFLGLTASLGLNVQPWSECPASAFGLGWTTFRPRLDNLQTSADNCQTSEIKVPLAARKVGLQFFHVLESLKIGPRNCYSFLAYYPPFCSK